VLANLTRSARLPAAAMALVVLAAAASLSAKPIDPAPAEPTEYLVGLAAGTDAAKVSAAAGMRLTGGSMVNPQWFFMCPADGAGRADVLSRLRSVPGVTLAAAGAGVPRERAGLVVDDPLFPQQWNLQWTNAPAAWARGVTGAGVTVGMVDDSLELGHPDLAGNIASHLCWDFGQNDPDPSPVYDDDGHGVATGGIVAAVTGNGLGIAGAAPGAKLAGLRLDFYQQNEQMFVDATLWHNDAIRVKNHSYSISQWYLADEATVAANRLSAGQGVINVRSAGNQYGNANAKAAQSDRTAITVAALGSNGRAAHYSNFGACVFVTAPSSSGWAGMETITTTDRVGPFGYDPGDYYAAFGGTSASAPLVSGIVAMMLQVNPGLDVRGVKGILARTSQVVDPDQKEWVTNGGGYHFNPHYGFGLIDADAATAMAATFQTPAPGATYTTGRVDVNLVLPDWDLTGVTHSFEMTGSAADERMETIELRTTFTHTYAGDFDIYVTSPFGTVSQLAYNHTQSSLVNLDWTFSSAAFWGEQMDGTWTIKVADGWIGDEGTWDSFTLTAYTYRMPETVPEPGGIGVLALAAAGLIRRRRG